MSRSLQREIMVIDSGVKRQGRSARIKGVLGSRWNASNKTAGRAFWISTSKVYSIQSRQTHVFLLDNLR